MVEKSMRGIDLPIQRRRAFTLIELIVVMTIMAILTAVAVPMLGGDGSAKLRTAARRAGGLFEQARSLALTRSEPVRVMVLEDPVDEERHRRQMAISVRDGEDWEVVSGPEDLPAGVVFDASQPGVPTEMMEVISGSKGTKSWRYFDIGANGTFSGSNPNFVVALGFVGGGAVEVPNPNQVDGFRITAAARPFYFRSPVEISKNLPES